MKKEYTKPAMRVVKIQQHKMLCSSPYDNQKSLDAYDDEEDDITDKHGIW